MNLTKHQWKFKPETVARETTDAYSSTSFTSWVGVARILAKRGFNSWEAEAIMRSKWTRWCRDEFADESPASPSTLTKYLNKYKITPHCKEVNDLVMGTFGVEYDLELNEDGVPCRRGTMPGNYHPNKTVLVPLGTPACCDPTSETYWSM